VPIAVTGCPKALTRAQKLAAAPKACRKKKGHKRVDCEQAAQSLRRKACEAHEAQEVMLPGTVGALSVSAGEEQRDVAPVRMAWAGFERRGDGLEDHAELTVVDTDYDGTAGMVTSGLRPASHDHGKVLDIERDEDSRFRGGERKQLLVGDAIELALFVGGPNVVTLLAE
jgi:hypothetical protein